MKTDEQYTILAVSERLDKVLAELNQEVTNLDLDENHKLGVALQMSQLKGIARFLRRKAKIIAETQP